MFALFLARLAVLLEHELLNVVPLDTAARPVVDTLTIAARQFFQFVLTHSALA